MAGKIPNVQLQKWREQHNLTRAELAERINQTDVGVSQRLVCDEERIRRWGKGEVAWPRDPYPQAIAQATGLRPEALGFSRTKRLAVAAAQPISELDKIADLTAWLDRGSRRDEAIGEIGQTALSMASAHTDVPPKTLLRHVIRVHREAQELLVQGDLRFGQMRELLQIDADLIAHAAVLLGDVNRNGAAEEYGKLAVRLAEEAGSNPGLAWYARCKTARWQGHYIEAANLARRGYDVTPPGPMKEQLAWYEANSAALFGDKRRALEAARRGSLAGESALVTIPNQSVWGFPSQRQTLFSLAVAVRTGDPETALHTAALADQAAAAGDEPAPATWAQIRLAAALAHVLKGDLSGVLHEASPVFDMPPELRVGTVTGYLDDLSRQLACARYATSADAVQLRRQITEFNNAALPDEPSMEGE